MMNWNSLKNLGKKYIQNLYGIREGKDSIWSDKMIKLKNKENEKEI